MYWNIYIKGKKKHKMYWNIFASGKSNMEFFFFYIFAFGSGQPEGFIHEPETEPIQFGFRKMNPTLLEMLIQPNPTLVVWVGLVRVVGLPGWMYTPNTTSLEQEARQYPVIAQVQVLCLWAWDVDVRPRWAAADRGSVHRWSHNHWRWHGSSWKIQEEDVKDLQDERPRRAQLLPRHRSETKYYRHHHLSRCVREEATRHRWAGRQ